jgi:hypothetical protein
VGVARRSRVVPLAGRLRRATRRQNYRRMPGGGREGEEALACLRNGEPELGEPKYPVKVVGTATSPGFTEQRVPGGGVRWVKPPLVLATFPEVHDAHHVHADPSPIPDGRHDTQRHDVVIRAEDVVLF